MVEEKTILHCTIQNKTDRLKLIFRAIGFLLNPNKSGKNFINSFFFIFSLKVDVKLEPVHFIPQRLHEYLVGITHV